MSQVKLERHSKNVFFVYAESFSYKARGGKSIFSCWFLNGNFMSYSLHKVSQRRSRPRKLHSTWSQFPYGNCIYFRVQECNYLEIP